MGAGRTGSVVSVTAPVAGVTSFTMGAPHFDEVAFAGPEHLDAAYVAAYDRKARVDPTSDLELLQARGLGSESTLVDFGAGTGTFALAASALCKRVIAVDVSPAMVDAIARRADALGATNVEAVQAGFLSYEHEGASPDFVYTRNALHHLPDFWKGMALHRIAGLLPEGGTLQLRDLVFAFDLPEAQIRVTEWLEASAVKSAACGWTREELETHLRTEYSTFTWLLEPLIVHAGFEIVTSDYGRLGVYADYVCVKRAAERSRRARNPAHRLLGHRRRRVTRGHDHCLPNSLCRATTACLRVPSTITSAKTSRTRR